MFEEILKKISLLLISYGRRRSGSIERQKRTVEVKDCAIVWSNLARMRITDHNQYGSVGILQSKDIDYSNGAGTDRVSFDSVKIKVKSITPAWTNGGNFYTKSTKRLQEETCSRSKDIKSDRLRRMVYQHS